MSAYLALCSICHRMFTAVRGSRGPKRSRCDTHRKALLKPVALKLVPTRGIAIRRECLTCHAPFIARDPAALYCGIACFLQHRKLA